MKSRYGIFPQWINLVSLLKYGLILSLSLLLLPFTSLTGFPLYEVFGNLFRDLTFGECFFVTLGFLCVAWSLMITQRLIVEGAFRDSKDLPALPDDAVPRGSKEWFQQPATFRQLAFFTLLALPAMAIIVYWAGNHVLGAAGALLAVFAGYILLQVLSLPARLADYQLRRGEEREPQEWYQPVYTPAFLRWSGGREGLITLPARFFGLLHRLFSKPFRWMGLDYMFPTQGVGKDLVGLDHFFAATGFFWFLVLLYRLWPAPWTELGRLAPAASSLYIWITLLTWTFSFFQFHLSKQRISPLLGVVAVMALGYSVLHTDNYYPVSPVKAANSAVNLSPAGGVPPNAKNLVVVTAPGGGIQAAGWTTLGLTKMVEKRPQIVNEIGLLSTVSGGSVGAAFFIDRLRRCQVEDQECRQRAARESLPRSVESSLGAATYGFALYDSWRVLGLKYPFNRVDDRGTLLTKQWARIASGTIHRKQPDDLFPPVSIVFWPQIPEDPPLSDLRKDILANKIPAFVFAATALEAGRRVMITPINVWPSGLDQRARTMEEYLKPGDSDLSLWTAARLSATFPYVSPAARAYAADDSQLPRSFRHHFIDGGYYDNYGITSALDWLRPVLKERPELERVAIVQLRSSRSSEPRCAKPLPGMVSALVGPVAGVVRIAFGAAFERDKVDLNVMIDTWNRSHNVMIDTWNRSHDTPRICQFVLEPLGGGEDPLSWHLTSEQKSNLVELWKSNPSNEDTIGALDDFLSGGKTCQRATPH